MRLHGAFRYVSHDDDTGDKLYNREIQDTLAPVTASEGVAGVKPEEAAIADPDVAARLGRLAKAERWSGFGEFGDTATVLTVARRGKAADESPPATHKQADKEPRAERPEATRQQRETALAAAERAQSEAAALSERQAELAAARLRHDQAREDLDAAERQVGTAEEGTSLGQASQPRHDGVDEEGQSAARAGRRDELITVPVRG